MRLFVMLLAWYMALAGSLYVFMPKVGRGLVGWMRERVTRRLGIVPILCAIAFFLTAPASRLPLALYLVGGVSLAKGIHLLIAPPDQVDKILVWFENQSLVFYRLWGAFALFVGVLVYWAV